MIRPSLIFASVLIVASTANAQRPSQCPGERPGRPPGGFPMPPGFHLMAALDADKDGKVSAEEIENAAAARKNLDADQDGKLDVGVVRPCGDRLIRGAGRRRIRLTPIPRR